MSKKLTLPWMNKIRELEATPISYRDLVQELKKYGEKEERRISDAY